MTTATNNDTATVTAEQFRDLISAVCDARASLAGCTETEKDDEAQHLINAMRNLGPAILLRRNQRLEERKQNTWLAALATLETRGIDT